MGSDLLLLLLLRADLSHRHRDPRSSAVMDPQTRAGEQTHISALLYVSIQK